MEVHSQLGMGFREAVYKDALEFAKQEIYYSREKKFEIKYKGYPLDHSYIADFVVYDKIILEVKATSVTTTEFIAQTINYLKASNLQLGILVNFGQRSFVFQRIIL